MTLPLHIEQELRQLGVVPPQQPKASAPRYDDYVPTREQKELSS